MAGHDQTIERAGGQVRVVIPGMGCLNCIGGLRMDLVQQEMLPEPDREVAVQLGYIDGAEVKSPAVASLNGAIANLAVTEFMAFVTSFRPVRRFVGYDFLNATVRPHAFPKDPDCFTCSSAGSLATGGTGMPLPLDLLIDEPQSHNKGQTTMANEDRNIQDAITQLLSRARQGELPIEGHAENRWLVIRQVTLGNGFTRPQADVMIKFAGQKSDPMIFVPDELRVEPTARVCPSFVAPSPCLKGWKALCPHMFQDIGDELLPFIACLCGFLANPTLCGCMGCPGKPAASQDTESDEPCGVRVTGTALQEEAEIANGDDHQNNPQCGEEVGREGGDHGHSI